VALADWLRAQQIRGLIALDEAAGVLLGMVASAPRRATLFGGRPLTSRSRIDAHVRTSAAPSLRGCPVQEVRSC
jgi:hypothetical protein